MVSWEIPELWLEFFRFFFSDQHLQKLVKFQPCFPTKRVMYQAAHRSRLWMENGQIHAAADLLVDLLIVVSEFFKYFCRSLKSFFLEYLQVKIGTIIGTTLI